MEDASKVQFGRLNDEGFYFSNGIMSLPYGHPSLENLRKEKQKHWSIHKSIQEEKYDFLKQKSKAIDNNPRFLIHQKRHFLKNLEYISFLEVLLKLNG